MREPREPPDVTPEMIKAVELYHLDGHLPIPFDPFTALCSLAVNLQCDLWGMNRFTHNDIAVRKAVRYADYTSLNERESFALVYKIAFCDEWEPDPRWPHDKETMRQAAANGLGPTVLRGLK